MIKVEAALPARAQGGKLELLKTATLSLLALAATRWWFHRNRHIEIAPALGKVLGAGLLAGRLAFVLTHLDVYASNPLASFDLRDGGFVATAGTFAALITGTECTRRSTGLRKPMVLALAAGALEWIAALIVTQHLSTTRMPAPATIVHQLDGKPINLDTFRGKPLVLNLWASWCPPCRSEMPVLRDAQSAQPDIEFAFINRRLHDVARQPESDLGQHRTLLSANF